MTMTRRHGLVGRSRRRARDRSGSQVDVDSDRRRARVTTTRASRSIPRRRRHLRRSGSIIAAIAKEGVASLAPAAEGGVWLGTSKGLFFVSEQGRLGRDADQGSDPRARARSRGLAVDRDEGGAGRAQAERRLVKIGAAQGCDVVEPRLAGRSARRSRDGDRRRRAGPRAARDRQGDARGRAIARCPRYKWDAATLRGNGIVVMGGGQVYRIALATSARRCGRSRAMACGSCR